MKSRLLDLDLRWWKSQYSTDHGLAVIVVDTTKREINRFGLIVFRPAHHTKSKAYIPCWLYRDRDLSRTALKQISSTLTVYQIEDDGSYTYCHIEWDQQRKRYICRRLPA